MINPPPRPALRKAPDADVHPVAVVSRGPAELRPVVGIGGRTSDTLVSRPKKKVKRSTLEVKVPKPLLKTAKEAAKQRKDTLDDVVEVALREYVARR